MSKVEVFSKIQKILAEQLHATPEKITESSDIKTDLGADSLDIAEIALVIKEEFDYDLNDQEMLKIKTVGDIVNILVLHVVGN